jgi:hypothetical protein
LGQVGFKENDDGLELKEPPQDSLLARLWPVVEDDFQSSLAERSAEAPLVENVIESPVHATVRTRLALDWSLPNPPEAVQVAAGAMEATAGELVEFDWAGETARHVGTVVHRLLQHIGKTGVDHIEQEDLNRFEQIGRKMLTRLGVPGDRLNAAVDDLCAALQASLEDERGKWILSNQHQEASCELALSSPRDGSIDHMVIDRTFVDEHGTRWIIDYKTGAHTGGGVDQFLDREQERYRPQLEGYANIMSKMEERPIRLGLYFPLLGGWREWS